MEELDGKSLKLELANDSIFTSDFNNKQTKNGNTVMSKGSSKLEFAPTC